KTSELLSGHPPVVIQMSRKALAVYLVQRVQDEVHRFAVSFHRHLRGKNLVQSELDKIPGVGNQRRRLLLRHFKNVSEIKKASIEDITKLGVPQNVAKKILSHLNNEEGSEKT